jgi:uncharacterized repeat protein (TIGR03943 family)
VKAILSKFVVSGILMTWGVVLSYFSFSGRVAAYLHPAFHPGLAISGIVLIFLAAAVFFVCPSPKTFPPRLLVPSFVLTVPLLFATAVSPGKFGSAAFLNRGLVENAGQLPSAQPSLRPADGAADEGAGLPKNEKGQIKASTVDLLYAAGEPMMREDFENKEVEVVGQFLPARTGNPNGDRFQLVRMFVMCCAADARPVSVSVQSREASFPEMTWLKISGKVTFPLESGKRAVLIVADSVQQTSSPEAPFTY